jgi:hypothetical protein
MGDRNILGLAQLCHKVLDEKKGKDVLKMIQILIPSGNTLKDSHRKNA